LEIVAEGLHLGPRRRQLGPPLQSYRNELPFTRGQVRRGRPRRQCKRLFTTWRPEQAQQAQPLGSALAAATRSFDLDLHADCLDLRDFELRSVASSKTSAAQLGETLRDLDLRGQYRRLGV